jgi:glycosyltransferase involved in cell wall biosynthesis
MMKISVVLTTKNEEKNIGELFNSLMNQEEPYEVIAVDSNSKDKTQKIVKEYSKKNKNIKLFIHPGARSESMNYGIKQATGDAVAFIGGDDIADKNWIKDIREALKDKDIVAGKLISKNKDKFGKIANVKFFHKDVNISYPGANTTYKKEVLNKLGGFDPWFFSAEDLELNLRAVEAGYKIDYNEKPKVYYRPRNNPFDFIKQSFWYGAGRKLLGLKYGSIWQSHSITDILKTQFSLLGIIKIFLGFLGYVYCVATVREYPKSNSSK